MITWIATWFQPRGRWSQTEIHMHMIQKVERLVLRRTPA
jgi:hypothetical protein